MTVPNTVANSRWWPRSARARTTHPRRRDALGEPLLAGSPQVQMVLEQAAHQLPTALSELIPKLGMGQLAATRIS